MAVVYGKLTDFGLDPISTHQPRVVFTPSDNGVFDGRLLATRPRTAIPDADGNFSVDLAPTTLVRPLVHYDIKILWLSVPGNLKSADHLAARLSVPEQGGSIADLLAVPADNPYMWAFQPTQPDPWPVGLIWVNTDTGDIRRRTA